MKIAGRAFRTRCECIEQKEREAEKEAAQQAFEINLLRRWEDSRFAITDFRADTFAFDDRKEKKVSAACEKYVEKWDEMCENMYGILFTGTVGTGKTFYSHAIANALIARGVSVMVTSIPRVLLSLQDGKTDKLRAIDALDKYQLLVIDDLGTERNSEYSREIVYSLIDRRVQIRLPLIVTTNLTQQEMAEMQDMQLRRIYDRVIAMCPIVFAMTGKSRRIEEAAVRKQRAREALLS